jgi:hypothetical protein
MKKLLFTLAVLLILFTIGCQENIIDPITQESLNKSNTIDVINIHRGDIPLQGILADPSVPFVEYYELSGNIQYEHKLLSGPDPFAKVSLSLEVKAILEDLPGNSIGFIAITSEDTLYVNEFGYMLEKSFPIQGVKNNLKLVCSFLVTSENICLSGRWLEIHRNGSLN